MSDMKKKVDDIRNNYVGSLSKRNKSGVVSVDTLIDELSEAYEKELSGIRERLSDD